METGWLIESFNKGRVTYWGGIHPQQYDDQLEWVENPMLAVRFSRKVDAEMVMVGVLGLKIPASNVHAVKYEVNPRSFK